MQSESDESVNPELDLRSTEASVNNQSSQKRLCWVCFGTEQDDEDSDVVWICPCQCKGTMKWVHEECLQKWIDEKQKRTNSLRVSCSQCKTHYILSFPPANCFVRLIEQYDKLLYGSSPIVAVSVVVGSIYWCCGSYGFMSIIQVMGYEEGRRMIEESDPLLLVIGLPIIPITLILAKLIKWEDFLLRLWRQSAPKLPRPLSYVIGEPPARPRANCDQLLTDPGFTEPLGCTRMICGALLLPTVSSIVGRIFFSRIGGSQWRRSLVGGLVFLLIKGVTKIYLRKSQYMRYSQRTIKNYVPQGSDGRGFDSGSQFMRVPNSSLDFDPSTSGADRRPGSGDSDGIGDLSLDRLHTTSPDDSDDEIGGAQMPRTRTMFSMTIRI